MRKILITATLALLFLSTYANPIKIATAQQIAENVLGRSTLKSTSPLYLKHIAVNNCDTLLYIFINPDGGFAIIAADDAVMPILGYSKTSTTGDITENVAFNNQLNRYKEIITLKKKTAQRGKNAIRAWQLLETDSSATNSVSTDSLDANSLTTTKIAEPLITSIWGQTGSYNDSCPSYVGCVAVAMGQIMRYHKWPKNGRGWHKYTPYEEPTYGQLFANFGATTYNWDLMPDRLRTRSTTAEKQALQQMLYHAGVSVNMSYTKDGSGAFDIEVPMALCGYFKYNHQTIKVCKAADYTAEEWISLIKNEIDNKRPVLYSGSTKDTAGHAWVVDGYDKNDYLHVNWGWDGDYDGYFAPNNMVLEGALFNSEISAIIGIEPADDVPLMWTQQASGFETAWRGISNISAVDNLTAWASAYDGIYSYGQCMDYCRTTDGGESWATGTIKISGYKNYSISMICAISAYEAWAAVHLCTNTRSLSSGKIVHTSNGGASWEVQSSASFSGSKAFPNIIHFWDANNGVCIGDPNGGYFEIYTTTDGGNNWTRVSKSNIPSNLSGEQGEVAYYAVYGDVIYFSTNKGRLFKSTNRGTSWTATQTPLTNLFIMAFKSEDFGVIKGYDNDNFVACRTTDGGNSWQSLGSQSNFYPSAIAYIPGTDTLVSAGQYSSSETEYIGLSYSTNDGETFTDFADFYKDIAQYTALAFSPDGKNGWAGSYNYNQYYCGMYHRGETKVIRGYTDIEKDKIETKNSINIFPNPASNSIVIQGVNNCQVTIYNSFGMKLMEFADYNENNNINISKLQSGLYIVEIKTKEGNKTSQLIINK